MIEHDMDFIGRLCDPVIVMAEGSVLFEGSVEDAKKDERVIESYLGDDHATSEEGILHCGEVEKARCTYRSALYLPRTTSR